MLKESYFSRALRQAISPLLAALLLTSIVAPAFADDAADDEGGGTALEKITGVPVHGFASMGFAEDSSTDNHRRYSRGFYLHNFDLYYSPDLGSRARFLAEVVFEPDSESQQPAFDAERLQAGYVVNKNLTAWVGRFHTPIGYYVLAYHHGMELQTAAEKPRFLDFEDHYGVVPTHSNGLWLNGNTTLGDQRIALMAWLANSDRITQTSSNYSSLDFNMAHNDNHHLGYGGRVNWIAAGALDGLQVGVSFVKETVDYMGNGTPAYSTTGTGATNDSTTNINTGTNFVSNFMMYGIHAVYEQHGFEFLNEAYGFHDSNLASGTPKDYYNSFAGYSQLAYWIQGVSAPYIRYERAAFNQKDPFFQGQYNGLPYTKGAIGYRYNLTDSAALKLEISSITFGAKSNTNIGQAFRDARVDYSIRF